MVKDVVEKVGVIENLKRLHSESHNRGLATAFFAPMAFTDEDYRTWSHPSGFHKEIYQKQMFKAGTWGADYHPEIRPCQQDIEILPHKGFDVFASTDLEIELRQHGINCLVIAGMPANICCESTGRTAMELGFYTAFIKDAVGAESWDAYRAATEVNYPQIVQEVLTVDEFLDQLQQAKKAA